LLSGRKLHGDLPKLGENAGRHLKAGGHIDFVKPLTLYYTGDLAYCAGTYQATNAR
jgi:hypothetical protein